MARTDYNLLLVFLLLAINLSFSQGSTDRLLPIVGNDNQLRTYTVYLKEPEETGHVLREGLHGLKEWHLSFLPNVSLDDSGEPRLVYSFRRTITGFIAMLTDEEATTILTNEGVLDAISNDGLEVLPTTTHTPEYLGLSLRNPRTDWTFPNQGEGMVIGVVDTGIQKGHPSFAEDDMLDPPAKWAGRVCGPEQDYCNKKVIRAECFPFNGTQLAKDTKDHGTGVAGITAGNFVDGANVNGQGSGVASGMAPRAHLAIYKFCETSACSPSQMAAAVDKAVEEEVDIINISLGGGSPIEFHKYEPNIASFGAIRSEILPVFSAGNGGPTLGTVHQVCPWEFTIGSSTTDRKIEARRTSYGHKPNPTLKTTSSRGPTKVAINGGIIKPDVIAPGHDIVMPTIILSPTAPKFTRGSGTSFATPHVAGIATLLKVSHPSWSPAAIKSAIMTTTDWLDADGLSIKKQEGGDASIHDIGAGHINATRANDPGLVYDLTADDYYPYLCGLGYQTWMIRKFAKREIYCHHYTKTGINHLNYPSFSVFLPLSTTNDVTVTRSLTNVAENMKEHEDYKADIVGLNGVHWHIKPDKLKFDKTGQVHPFEIEFKKKHHHTPAKGSTSEGYLIWKSDKKEEHKVRSPIIVKFT